MIPKRLFTIALFTLPTVVQAIPLTYQLGSSSVFARGSNSASLSGTIALDFPFGLPPPTGYPLSYNLVDMDLNADALNIIMTGVNPNVDFYHGMPLGGVSDIDLNADNSISNMYDVNLELSQTAAGDTYYAYHELWLTPVEATNPTFNNMLFSSGGMLPSSLVLTYELHEILSRADQVIYPPGVIGLSWLYSITSDQLLGTLTISATASPVPLPTAFWLFGSGLIGLVGIARRKA